MNLSEVHVQELPWDSRHFGIRMGELSFASGIEEAPFKGLVEAALKEARAAGLRQLMARAHPSQIRLIHALEENAFRLVDTLMTLELTIPSKTPAPPELPPVRLANGKDLPGLMQLAREAFADREVWLDRFHADPHIPKEKADGLYAEWIRNSVQPNSPEESMADCTLVAEVDGTLAGFITCVRSNGNRPGKIPLNAVDKPFRGQGIYRSLVLRSLAWLREHDTQTVWVRTSVFSQPVQRTWIRLGALPKFVEHTFHWWA